MKTVLVGLLAMQLLAASKRSFSMFKTGGIYDIEEAERAVKPRIEVAANAPTCSQVAVEFEEPHHAVIPEIFDFEFAEVPINCEAATDIDSIINSLSWLDLETAPARPLQEIAPCAPSALYVPRGFENMTFVDLYFEWSLLSDISPDGKCSSSRCSKLFAHLLTHFSNDPTIQLLMHSFGVQHFSQLFSALRDEDDVLITCAFAELLNRFDRSYTPTSLQILVDCLSDYDFPLEVPMLLLSCRANISEIVLQYVFTNLAEEIPDHMIINLVQSGNFNFDNAILVMPYLEISQDVIDAAQNCQSPLLL